MVQRVTYLKGDILKTVQAVIHVASEYTCALLPDQATHLVKEFILELPLRWLTRNQPRNTIGSLDDLKVKIESETETCAIEIPKNCDHDIIMSSELYSDVCEKTGKVLTFATESLNTTQNIAQVFYSAVGRVDTWLDRFNVQLDNTDGGCDKHLMPGASKSRCETEEPVSYT
jgi:hypothetical protein